MIENKEPTGDISPIDPEPLYTVEDVAKFLGFSLSVVYKLVASGEIEALRIHNVWRIKKSAYERFVDTRPTNLNRV